MPQTVIDMLEVIQIQIKQCPGLSGFLCLINLSGKISLTAHSVVKPCQEIRISLLLYLPLIQLFIRNIIHGIQNSLSAHPPM